MSADIITGMGTAMVTSTARMGTTITTIIMSIAEWRKSRLSFVPPT